MLIGVASKSRITRSGAEPRSRVPARASTSPSVNPSRCAVSASSAVPTRDESPVPSAATSSVLTVVILVTFKVHLLSGRVAGLVTAILPAQADDSAHPHHHSPHHY